LYGEKITKWQAVGIGLCMMGAMYVVTQGNWIVAKKVVFNKSDLLVMIATVMYGLYSALLPKSPKINAATFLTCLSFLGAMTMAPLYIWDVIKIGATAPTLDVILGVCYVAIFPSLVAYLCWNKGISVIGPNRASVLICLVPIFSAILAVPYLNEKLALYHVVGMCLIFSGMILFNNNYVDKGKVAKRKNEDFFCTAGKGSGTTVPLPSNGVNARVNEKKVNEVMG
jgi:drug/metabolite transporter (DMT)-like permease